MHGAADGCHPSNDRPAYSESIIRDRVEIEPVAEVLHLEVQPLGIRLLTSADRQADTASVLDGIGNRLHSREDQRVRDPARDLGRVVAVCAFHDKIDPEPARTTLDFFNERPERPWRIAAKAGIGFRVREARQGLLRHRYGKALLAGGFAHAQRR